MNKKLVLVVKGRVQGRSNNWDTNWELGIVCLAQLGLERLLPEPQNICATLSHSPFQLPSVTSQTNNLFALTTAATVTDGMPHITSVIISA